MAKGKSGTVAIVEELARPVAQRFGIDIWDIRFEKEGPDWYLRIFLDKPEGVNIQDCENFSRAIDPLLDEADPIGESYILEVSSPGLGRRLTRPAHFARMAGERVQVRLIRPEEGGLREWYATLQGEENGVLSLIREEDGRPVTVNLNQTSFVKLCDDEDLF